MQLHTSSFSSVNLHVPSYTSFIGAQWHYGLTWVKKHQITFDLVTTADVMNKFLHSIVLTVCSDIFKLWQMCKAAQHNFMFFYTWAIAGLFFVSFRSFSNKHQNNFTSNQCEKCPSSIWHWDSNPRPSERESPPITPRPGLPCKVLLHWFGGPWLSGIY